jgi:hypothetical protein
VKFRGFFSNASARANGESLPTDRSIYSALVLALVVAAVLVGLLAIPRAPRLALPAQPTAYPVLPDQPPAARPATSE